MLASAVTASGYRLFPGAYSARSVTSLVEACQIGLSICAVTDAASCPLSWRLFPPAAWDDPEAATEAAAAAIGADAARGGNEPLASPASRSGTGRTGRPTAGAAEQGDQASLRRTTAADLRRALSVRRPHLRRRVPCVAPVPTAARGGRSRPCERARLGVPARPVTTSRRDPLGARSDPAARDVPAPSVHWGRPCWPTTRARRVARSGSGRPSWRRGCIPLLQCISSKAGAARPLWIGSDWSLLFVRAPGDADSRHLAPAVTGAPVLPVSSPLQNNWRLASALRLQGPPRRPNAPKLNRARGAHHRSRKPPVRLRSWTYGRRL